MAARKTGDEILTVLLRRFPDLDPRRRDPHNECSTAERWRNDEMSQPSQLHTDIAIKLAVLVDGWRGLKPYFCRSCKCFEHTEDGANYHTSRGHSLAVHNGIDDGDEDPWEVYA